MKDKNCVSRILWASRRGLLELDLLFEPFVYSNYRNFNEMEKIAFRSLLERDDHELFAWFFGSTEPPEEFSSIIKDVLDSYKSVGNNS